MSTRVFVACAILACMCYLRLPARYEAQAEAEGDSGVVVAESDPATAEPMVDAAHGDLTLATLVALLAQEEIGWNEFGAEHVLDSDIQKFARKMIDERRRLLRELHGFAPDATRSTYLNMTAKDAREMGPTIVRTPSARRGKTQEVEDHRLDVYTPPDRASAQAAGVASYRGAVAAALRYDIGLQSPRINPPADNLVANPAGILPGNSEGGSLFPDVVGIKAPGADSAAAIGVGSLAQAGAGQVAQSAGGVGSVGGAKAGATGGAGRANVAGQSNVAAAGANARVNVNAGNSPGGLFSGPAGGVQGPQSDNQGSTNPTGLLSGPAAGTQGPQSGNVSSKNPTGLLSGVAAGSNGNTAVGAAANGPTGLFSGPGAGTQGPQSGTTASTNPTGLLSGPAAGIQGPQSGNTSSKNPTGLLSGPAVGQGNSNGSNQTSNASTNTVGANNGNGAATDQSAGQTATGGQTIGVNGNVFPAIGVVGNGSVATGEQAVIGDGSDIAAGPLATGTTGNRPTAATSSRAPQRVLMKNGPSALSTTDRRTILTDASDSPHRAFDAVQVERELAVQSLAGSKRLIELKTGHEIDNAFLKQELAIQKALLDKCVTYQKFASDELNEVLSNAELQVKHNLEMTRDLIEQRAKISRQPSGRGGRD